MLSASFVGDQGGLLKHLQVPRDGGLGNREGLGQLADRRLALRQARQDRPTSRVGECAESVVEHVHLNDRLNNLSVKSSTIANAIERTVRGSGALLRRAVEDDR